MSKPSYEEYIGYKKLTAKQHAQRLKKYEELYGSKEEVKVEVENNTPRPGRCKCGSASFGLKVKNHNFMRTCNKCGEVKVV